MSRIIMIAVADLMLCIAAQAMLIYEDDHAAKQAEFAAQEERLQTERVALDHEKRRVEREIDKRQREAEQDLVKIQAAITLERQTLRTIYAKKEGRP